MWVDFTHYCPMNRDSKRNLTAMALVLCLSLSLGACMSINSDAGTRMTADKVAQIKKGVTTRGEVEALLGSPMTVSMTGEGKRVLTYYYSSIKMESRAGAATFIPLVGPFAASAKTQGQIKNQTLQVMLNAAGVVEDYEFTDNTQDMAGKSGGFMGTTTTATTQPAEKK